MGKEKKKDVEEEKKEEVKEEAEEPTEDETEEKQEEEKEETTEEGTEEERKDRFGRELHKVKCSECGRDTEVPFKPSGDRPVYCRECYQKHRPRRNF